MRSDIKSASGAFEGSNAQRVPLRAGLNRAKPDHRAMRIGALAISIYRHCPTWSGNPAISLSIVVVKTRLRMNPTQANVYWITRSSRVMTNNS
jgi:hypothetical protein